VPQWTPSQRELDDLDLITLGAVPITGFTSPEGERGLPGLTLTVPAAVAEEAVAEGSLDLLDPEGVPLARLTVTGTYPVGGPAGGDAGGAAAPPGQVGLVGPLSTLSSTVYGPFRRYVAPPQEGSGRVAVPVEAPLTESDIAGIRATSEAGRPLLLVLIGAGYPRGVSAPALVRASLAAAADIPGADVVAVPLARRRPDGSAAADDERLLDAVAAAYADSTSRPSYQGELPVAVAAVVEQDRPPRERRGVVVFFTGLSGSGKSTIARALYDTVLERGDRTVTSLDGDVVRHHLSKGLGFSREDRETNIRRIGWVGAEISRHGGMAICSPIAPFDATRQEVRTMARDAGGGFVLVHVATPLEECERRDRKGLYARARAGLIPDFTGISSPYEAPADADVAVDTTGRSVADCLDEVLAVLIAEGWLTRV
jgi:sulfate adenylyltransferase